MITEFGNFRNNNLSEFSDPTCHPDKVHVSNGVATFSASAPCQCYGDTAKVRVHMLGFAANPHVSIAPGSTFYWAWSIRKTSTPQASISVTLNELHQPNGQSYCPTLQGGPAPYNFDSRVLIADGKNYWNHLIRGSNDCSNPAFNSTTWGKKECYTQFEPNNPPSRDFRDWQGMSAEVIAGQWLHNLIAVKVDPTTGGTFQAWAAYQGNQMVQVVPKTNVATNYAQLLNYPILSMYYEASQTGLCEYQYANGAFGDDLAQITGWQATEVGYDLWNSAAPTPPPTPTPGPTPPVDPALPTITIVPAGTPKVGSTLTAVPGTYTPTPTGYSYQWQRETAAGGGQYGDITNAINKTYIPTTADVGRRIRVGVTGVTVVPPSGPLLDYTFDNGFGGFDFEGANLGQQATLQDSTRRRGGKQAALICRPTDTFGGAPGTRALMARYDTGQGVGDFWWLVQFKKPSYDTLIWELHQDSSMYNLPGSIAPYAVLLNGGKIICRTCTGDYAAGSNPNAPLFWHPNEVLIDAPSSTSWIDVVMHCSFTESNTGFVEWFVDPTGRGAINTGAPKFRFTNIQTIVTYRAGGVTGHKLYMEQGLYIPNAHSNTESITHGGSVRATSFADLQPYLVPYS